MPVRIRTAMRSRTAAAEDTGSGTGTTRASNSGGVWEAEGLARLCGRSATVAARAPIITRITKLPAIRHCRRGSALHPAAEYHRGLAGAALSSMPIRMSARRLTGHHLRRWSG
jgi:hypothetical protein